MTVPSELETATTQGLEQRENGSTATELNDENPTSDRVDPAAATVAAIADTGEVSGASSDLVTSPPAMLESAAEVVGSASEPSPEAVSYEDELPDEVEMSLFDHLEELRQRIFVALLAVVVGAIACFALVKDIVRLLEIPAQGVKFLQLAPGEFFFVSIKVAGYCGVLLATPVILYEVAAFVLPGLTRKERRLLGPIVFGSSILFVGGLAFAYIALIPAALNFFISYGADVVEQSWSIEKYFDFVLLLMLSTGLAFQVPIIQALLGMLGVVSSRQMVSGWKFVLLGSAIVGAVLTPSTDPLTQSLLGGAMVALYFGGIGLVKLLGK
ncbi:MAG: twin-arginine translocase subunit TatC [Leptolyngbyaceae cyanobacterium bins.349]|nr:twin-arginine translocase subunit TatC [Leptolyngbyaceae cyanobacterium bins.349]